MIGEVVYSWGGFWEFMIIFVYFFIIYMPCVLEVPHKGTSEGTL